MRVCIMHNALGGTLCIIAGQSVRGSGPLNRRASGTKSKSNSGSQHRATTGVPVALSESVASSRSTTAWKRPGCAARHPLTRWLAGHQPESIQTQQAPGGRASTQQGTERAGFAPR